MPGEIIMPVLGMAQDKGLIVAWHKKVGDEVKDDDVLFEVETDKANVEVPSGKSGFLAEILEEAGKEVPVGQTIAIISAEKQTGDTTSKAKARAAVELLTTAEALPVQEAPSDKRPNSTAVDKEPAVSRILASPKAKRLAAERGIDLKALVAGGLPQPYHVADLAKASALTDQNQPTEAEEPQSEIASGTVAELCEYEAVVEARPSAEFVSWATEKLGRPLERALLWAAFAASSLERDMVIIRVESRNISQTYKITPRIGLSQITAEPIVGKVDIVIHDLSETRVSAFRGGNSEAAMLLIARGREPGTLVLTLRFSEDGLPRPDALRFLEAYLARMEDPLNHLL